MAKLTLMGGVAENLIPTFLQLLVKGNFTNKCYVCTTGYRNKPKHMMKVGNKIHKIRELKNITAKDMADRLDMTTAGYQKIERDEVSINMDRLLEIAGIFEMKPEDVLSFDEKMVFNNHGEIKGGLQQSINYGTQNIFPQEMKDLYEKQIKLLEEQNQFLKERLKYWEGK